MYLNGLAKKQTKISASFIKMKEVRKVVELDQYKYTLSTYEKPLKEVGDSL